MIKKFLIEFIATFGFVGKIKYAPGTCASIVTICLINLLSKPFLDIGAIEYFGFATPKCPKYLCITSLTEMFVGWLMILLILSFILFIIGTIFSAIYVKKYSNLQDPKEVVIDEVVGQMLTVMLCHLINGILSDCLDIFWSGYLVDTFAFIFFRIFDIFKPWPISWFDRNIKGGIGIMLDDVIAAVFAAIAFFLFIELPMIEINPKMLIWKY